MNKPVAPADRFANTSAAEFHRRLDALLPLVEAEAEAGESASRLTDAVDAALREAGIYTMLLPKDVGGPELSHFDAMTIVERLSYAHASAGWCVLASVMESAAMAIYIADGGIRKVFANGPNVAMAGNGVPRGFARAVDGGYMIRGRWAYGSAITHADWIHTGCFLVDPKTGEMVMQPNGQPKIVITHHPRATIKLLGNWDVLGLRATGSFADGNMHFVDRKKNVIRRSGENIAALEVEGVLQRHPAIAQIGVTSVPDKLRGEEVIACVILKPGERADRATAESIVAWCLERLAYYKAPGWVSFGDTLPITPTLKIQRADLKKMGEQVLGAAATFDTRALKKRDA